MIFNIKEGRFIEKENVKKIQYEAMMYIIMD